jgi:hypothetical protein
MKVDTRRVHIYFKNAFWAGNWCKLPLPLVNMDYHIFRMGCSPRNGSVGGPGGSDGERRAERASCTSFQATQPQNKRGKRISVVSFAIIIAQNDQWQEAGIVSTCTGSVRTQIAAVITGHAPPPQSTESAGWGRYIVHMQIISTATAGVVRRHSPQRCTGSHWDLRFLSYMVSTKDEA